MGLLIGLNSLYETELTKVYQYSSFLFENYCRWERKNPQ